MFENVPNKPLFPEYDPTTGKRIGGIIENWSYHCWSKSQEVYVVYGNIYNDPCWIEGFHIRTSAVVKLDREAKTLETLNTFYTLGEEFKGETE